MFVSVVSLVICDWEIRKRELFLGESFNIFEMFYLVVSVLILNLGQFDVFRSEWDLSDEFFYVVYGENKIIISWKDKLLGFLCQK